MQGRKSTMASSLSSGTFISSSTRWSAASALFMRVHISSSFFFFHGSSSTALLQMNRVVEVMISSTIVSRFLTSVAPVDVLSIIMSASSGGRASVAPYGV